MECFTVDRGQSLQPGLRLDLVTWNDLDPPWAQSHLDSLFPEGVSTHGERYFVSGDIPATDISANIELIFEYVRRFAFPHALSRFQAFYAAPTVEYARAFRAAFGSANDPIWRVGGEEALRADMSLLSLGGSALTISWAAHQYWAGGVSSTPLMESLLRPPVDVIGRVDEP